MRRTNPPNRKPAPQRRALVAHLPLFLSLTPLKWPELFRTTTQFRYNLSFPLGGVVVPQPTVGLIGLGLMGLPMGHNLLKAGFPLVVWNRTVSPALPRKIAAASATAGIRFLDAPVTGGTWGAEKGELVFMIGGEAATLEAARPVLSAMGKKLFHLGPNGAGQTIKLAMNSLLAVEVQAFAEALALVQRAGLPGEKLVEVMQSSMARAGILDIKAPSMLSGDFKPSFPLRLMHKDLSLALDLANQIGVALPATAAARETYNYVKGSTSEDLDYAGVMRFWTK